MDEGFLLVVAVVTAGPVHVGLYLHRYRYAAHTGSGCVVVLMVMVVAVAVPAVMPPRGVRTIFGFERFVHRCHDQVHGTQHVCQHMIRLYLEVVAL